MDPSVHFSANVPSHSYRYPADPCRSDILLEHWASYSWRLSNIQDFLSPTCRLHCEIAYKEVRYRLTVTTIVVQLVRSSVVQTHPRHALLLYAGLGTVYAINTALTVLAVFKAKERGQSAALWAAKTFSVGGLAYDQLTQLPTLEEVERSKSVKGKRALKNRKKQ